MGGDFAAGADSSNRPWETDALRIDADRPPLALGYLAIAAATLLALNELAPPDWAAGSGASGGRAVPAGPLPWRLLAGHYLGLLLLPAYLGGYWLVRWGLRDAGGWHAWPVFLLGTNTALLAVALHGQLGPLAVVAQHPSAPELLAATRPFTAPLQTLVIALLACLSLWFALGLAGRSSCYPRWLAAANPFVLALLFTLPTLADPSSQPGLLRPAPFHLAHLVFFTLVTLTLRRAPIPEDGGPAPG